jgi:hypothetical protein
MISSRYALSAAVIAFASAAIFLAMSGGVSGAATTLYVAASGSDRNACTQPAPCRSFDRAYQMAAPGQVVTVGGGVYPAQSINRDPRKNTPPNVVFQPAPGASVQVGRLTISASNLTVQNMQFPWSIRPGADHVTLQQIDANGAIDITGASNVSVLGGQIYSTSPVTSDPQIASYNGLVPTSIVFDGVAFHDWVDAGPTPGTHHIECLQFGAGVNVTIRNSTFQRCETHDIFIRSWGTLNGNPSPLRNFTIQNNQFGATLAGYYSLRLALQVGWPCTNFLIAGNIAAQNMFSDCTAAGVQFLGNTQPSMSAYSCAHLFGSVWIGNTFGSGVACGKNQVLNGGGGGPPPPPDPKPKSGGDGGGKPATAATPDAGAGAASGGDGSEASGSGGSASRAHGKILGVSSKAISISTPPTTLTCLIGARSPSIAGYSVGQDATLVCGGDTGHVLVGISH